MERILERVAEGASRLMPRLLLAIDPGPVESAWVLLRGSTLVEFAKEPNGVLLLRLMSEELTAEVTVIEKIASYGMAVGEEVFETVFWSGRFAQAIGGDVERLTRLKVKQQLCRDSRAKDGNIRQALIDRYGGPASIKKGGPLYKVSGDVWAALAVGVAWNEGAR